LDRLSLFAARPRGVGSPGLALQPSKETMSQRDTLNPRRRPMPPPIPPQPEQPDDDDGGDDD